LTREAVIEKEKAMIKNRRYERVTFLCNVLVSGFPNGAATAARSLDISLGGVGIITQGTYEVGQLVTISFLLKDREKEVVVNEVAGRIVYFRADVDANRVGVEFLQPLHESKHPELMRRFLKI
jgi:c-di-GMP-binding flagellar brake protein YcgR